MSIKLTTMALDSPFKPTPKLVLIIYCDYSNDDGICFPSNKKVMRRAGIAKTTLVYIRGTFVKIGLLKTKNQKRDNGSDTSNLYFINIEKLELLSNIEKKIKNRYPINDEMSIEAQKEINKKRQIAIKKEEEQYLKEYKKAYDEIKGIDNKGSLSEPSHKKTKNYKVNPRVHQGDPLEPPYIHQEIPKGISSSKERRETFDNFKARIVDTYSGYALVYGPKGFLNTTVISVSPTGYLFNNVSNKDLSSEDAISIWQWLYINQEKILPIKKEVIV